MLLLLLLLLLRGLLLLRLRRLGGGCGAHAWLAAAAAGARSGGVTSGVLCGRFCSTLRSRASLGWRPTGGLGRQAGVWRSGVCDEAVERTTGCARLPDNSNHDAGVSNIAGRTNGGGARTPRWRPCMEAAAGLPAPLQRPGSDHDHCRQEDGPASAAPAAQAAGAVRTLLDGRLQGPQCRGEACATR